MAFNGTWKIDRNENYDKFMEKMGERFFSSGSLFCFSWRLPNPLSVRGCTAAGKPRQGPGSCRETASSLRPPGRGKTAGVPPGSRSPPRASGAASGKTGTVSGWEVTKGGVKRELQTGEGWALQRARKSQDRVVQRGKGVPAPSKETGFSPLTCKPAETVS